MNGDVKKPTEAIIRFLTEFKTVLLKEILQTLFLVAVTLGLILTGIFGFENWTLAELSGYLAENFYGKWEMGNGKWEMGKNYYAGRHLASEYTNQNGSK